jgi:hypothetical protein
MRWSAARDSASPSNDPEVPIDTNQLKRRWCRGGGDDTEPDRLLSAARHRPLPLDLAGQSLQRVNRRPAKDIEQLILRNWKGHFAGDLLRSDRDYLGS